MPVEPCYKRLGAAIAEGRRAAELSQEQLAKKLKISRANIANIEAGRQRMPLHKIFELEKIFGEFNSLINKARGRNTT